MKIQLNKQEQAEYGQLQQMHAMSKSMGLSDSEIVEIAKTNGDIDRAAMYKYCDDYNVSRP